MDVDREIKVADPSLSHRLLLTALATVKVGADLGVHPDPRHVQPPAGHPHGRLADVLQPRVGEGQVQPDPVAP